MSKKHVILILTERLDPHADYVIGELERRGEVFIRFDTADFPLDARLDAQLVSGAWSSTLRFEGRELRFDDVKSIWYRRPRRFQVSPDLSTRERAFAEREAEAGLGGILRSLPVLWVNHPEKVVSADHKPFQLAVAHRHGFATPRSIITNDPDAARAFIADCPTGAVYKAVSSSGVIITERGFEYIYTHRMDQDAMDRLDEVRHTACLFQEYVQKRSELRVTVVDNDVFAAEIVTNGEVTDWRKEHERIRELVPFALPSEVESAVRALVRDFGLRYAALDLILTPDGEYVFLESNPNGQWAWVEQQTGLPISRALVDLLAEGRKELIATAA